jgi:hypothetical protein
MSDEPKQPRPPVFTPGSLDEALLEAPRRCQQPKKSLPSPAELRSMREERRRASAERILARLREALLDGKSVIGFMPEDRERVKVAAEILASEGDWVLRVGESAAEISPSRRLSGDPMR